jgi:pimeloyl-ACP methyl ester carboxylesterase
MPSESVRGTALHYESSGDGAPALCLVHGSGGSTEAWRAQIVGLADITRVVAVDLPAHGRSGGDGVTSIDDAAGYVRALVESLGVGPVVIAGHSMGGAIAQAFALAAPGLTAGVVLVGTGARLRVLPKIFELIDHDYPAAVEFITDMGVAARAPDALRRSIAAATRRTRPRILAGDFGACDRFDVMPRLPEIEAPALVICGDEDRLTPPKYSRYFEAHLPNARLVLVPGAGHYVQLEQPEAVTAALAEFLRTLPASRA